ncbi:chaperonin GroEL, partial [Candidatus Bathyarchaeota archaeon]|nr:chaperonin GroEL [Candidatus Bathyarchaeota archaeon]
VPGGGVALIRTIPSLDDLEGVTDGENTGIKIIRRALEEPLRQIADNAGLEEAVIVDNVASRKGNYGYNARTEEYGDMVEMGIIDPTQVVKAALSNAASIAALLLTIDAMVAEEPEEEEGNDGGEQGHGHSGF